MKKAAAPKVKAFFEPQTSTLTYVAYDPETQDAVVIDPVLDYEPQASTFSLESTQKVVSFLREENLTPHLIIETHVHADHISSAPFVQKEFPDARIVIGRSVTEVQKIFKDVYAMDNLATDGRQFDRLIKPDEIFEAGSLTIQALHTPGHTPTCTSYLIGNCVFTGDALFMPDFGTGRCDFPKGSARQLYHSITNVLYKLPDDTRVFVGHDYQPGGRDLAFETSIGDSKKNNKHLGQDTTLEAFVSFREERDRTLKYPKLLLASLQININAGVLPTPNDQGQRFLKIPLSPKN